MKIKVNVAIDTRIAFKSMKTSRDDKSVSGSHGCIKSNTNSVWDFKLAFQQLAWPDRLKISDESPCDSETDSFTMHTRNDSHVIPGISARWRP